MNKVLKLIITCIATWIILCNTIQAFKCPELTPTELFLNLGHSITLNFKTCK